MYLENRKPRTIIVTPRISDATLTLGVLGVTCVVSGVTCDILGLVCVVVVTIGTL